MGGWWLGDHGLKEVGLIVNYGLGFETTHDLFTPDL